MGVSEAALVSEVPGAKCLGGGVTELGFSEVRGRVCVSESVSELPCVSEVGSVRSVGSPLPLCSIFSSSSFSRPTKKKEKKRKKILNRMSPGRDTRVS